MAQIEWLKLPDPEFDFLDFEEAERLLAAADEGAWRTMILVALRTGMRQGRSWRIAATSPAVDAGLPQPGLTCNFIGVARDALPDVGAFEYAVGTMP